MRCREPSEAYSIVHRGALSREAAWLDNSRHLTRKSPRSPEATLAAWGTRSRPGTQTASNPENPWQWRDCTLENIVKLGGPRICSFPKDQGFPFVGAITPARKFRMLLHINPTRQRGKRTGSLARASGWYMTFFAAGVIKGVPAPSVQNPTGKESLRPSTWESCTRRVAESVGCLKVLRKTLVFRRFTHEALTYLYPDIVFGALGKEPPEWANPRKLVTPGATRCPLRVEAPNGAAMPDARHRSNSNRRLSHAATQEARRL